MQEENLVADIFDNYSETQKELLQIESRKVRNKLIGIGIVIFCFDLFATLTTNTLNLQVFIWLLLFPVLYLGLGMLAMREPLVAMIIGALIIVALWVYLFIQIGGYSLIMGWIPKIIIIYMLIAGFMSANEAHVIRRELKQSGQ